MARSFAQATDLRARAVRSIGSKTVFAFSLISLTLRRRLRRNIVESFQNTGAVGGDIERIPCTFLCEERVHVTLKSLMHGIGGLGVARGGAASTVNTILKLSIDRGAGDSNAYSGNAHCTVQDGERQE